ncbi:urea transporter [Leptothrix ochracea]|uniref:urea transporter n=1 Tax=Leptothrix ochracea TaxID=735331 RepID=UPI0034E27A01
MHLRPLALPAIPELLVAYGAPFMARRPWVGALVLLATLMEPSIGGLGLAAGLAALGTRALLRLPALVSELDVLNAVYVGLVLGAFHGLDAHGLSLGLAVLGGAMTVLLGTALAPRLQQMRELPLLGAPFLLSAWVLLATARALDLPMRGISHAATLLDLPTWLDQGLSLVGALLYVANPLSGLVLGAALLLASPALGLLTLAGGTWAWGLTTLGLWAAAGDLAMTTPSTLTSPLPMLAAFNGALTALVLCTQMLPQGRAWGVITAGVLGSTVLSAAGWMLLRPLGLPVLSAPFLLTVWLLRAALRAEHSAFWARFWLQEPLIPEESLSRLRLEHARGVDRSSLALRLPFQDRMDVSQGVDGPHTHQGPWRYALDFIRTEQGRSFRGAGQLLSDFHTFDQPVLSPVWGWVVSCRHDLPDNAPGEINLHENWGNHVLIRLGAAEDDRHVLLAHLRQGSLLVLPGQWLVPGMLLGRCGNSGRSAQPHLHLHVQRGGWLGAPTCPFHLTGYQQDGGRFVLDGTPHQGQALSQPASHPALTQALSLPAGRVWRFSVGAQFWTLWVELDVLGNPSLVSDRGARMAATHTDLLFALHQRSGQPDPILDAFALSLGLTPLMAADGTWCDAPSIDLLPMQPLQRLRRVLRHPLGDNLSSHYRRHWDAEQAHWVQRGTHRLTLLGGAMQAETTVWLRPEEGPVGFELRIAGQTEIRANLAGFGNHGDHGVPAWSVDLAAPTLTAS